MPLEYTPYVLPLLASASVTAMLGIYGWRHRAVPGAIPFAIAMGIITPWSVANALEMSGSELPTKIFWANLQHMGNVSIPVALLAMVLQYSNRDQWLARRRLVWLCAVPLITAALVWTNDLHGLIRRDVYLDTAGPFRLWPNPMGLGSGSMRHIPMAC